MSNVINFLPYDGIAEYYGKVFTDKNANDYYHRLLKNVEWKNDEANFFGKKYITKRKVAWYADKQYEYAYSNTIKKALPWLKELTELKEIIQKVSGEKYNSCLANLYHDGNEGMAYHSDDEKDLKPFGAIASVSFGAERRFLFKHKTEKQIVELNLEHGSLMIMKGLTQKMWKHRLPMSKKILIPRINLTFRMIMK